MAVEIVAFALDSLFPQAGASAKASLPLAILLFRNLRGLAALGAGNADLITVGDAIGRRDDDAIVRGDARGQFDVLAKIAGDGHGLEQHLVVSADGRNTQTVLVENESACG